jgi:hypothetical protein
VLKFQYTSIFILQIKNEDTLAGHLPPCVRVFFSNADTMKVSCKLLGKFPYTSMKPLPQKSCQKKATTGRTLDIADDDVAKA